MNETLQTIHSRRSIRSYLPDRIAKDVMDAIVDAGKAAPSGMNRQPYHITVVQDPQALRDLVSLAKKEALKGPMAERAKDPAFDPTYGAPAFILVSAEEKLPTGQFDATLVLSNMFLAARSLGVGSCLIFMYGAMAENPEARELYAKLGVPAGYKVIVGSSFGYPAGEWPEAKEKRADNVNYV